MRVRQGDGQVFLNCFSRKYFKLTSLRLAWRAKLRYSKIDSDNGSLKLARGRAETKALIGGGGGGGVHIHIFAFCPTNFF